MKPFEKVLLIDDDEIVNSINSVIIKHAKFALKIDSTNSVPSALEYLSEASNQDEYPEVIFLDLNMPDQNGWDFIEEYAKLGTHNSTKIIMLTSSISMKDQERASSLEQVTAFISKPLSPELLKDIYNDFLDDSQIEE